MKWIPYTCIQHQMYIESPLVILFCYRHTGWKYWEWQFFCTLFFLLYIYCLFVSCMLPCTVLENTNKNKTIRLFFWFIAKMSLKWLNVKFNANFILRYLNDFWLIWHFQRYQNHEHLPHKDRFSKARRLRNIQDLRNQESDGWNCE